MDINLNEILSDLSKKDELLQSPQQFLKKNFDIIVDEKVKIHVHESTQQQFHLLFSENVDLLKSLYGNTPLFELMKEAVSDPVLKETLLNDPAFLLCEKLGMNLSMDMQIHVNDEENIHVILPQEFSTDELSTSELQQAQGGTTSTCYLVSKGSGAFLPFMEDNMSHYGQLAAFLIPILRSFEANVVGLVSNAVPM